MKNLNLYVVNENHDILEKHNGKSIRELFLKVCEKHFNLYDMVQRLIINQDKNINDENLEKMLELYFNNKKLNCIIGVPFTPEKIVVYYDEN